MTWEDDDETYLDDIDNRIDFWEGWTMSGITMVCCCPIVILFLAILEICLYTAPVMNGYIRAVSCFSLLAIICLVFTTIMGYARLVEGRKNITYWNKFRQDITNGQ